MKKVATFCFKNCRDILYTMHMRKKEKLAKDVVLRVHPSLFKKFQKACEGNYKTISEVIRDFMVEYTQRNETKVRDYEWERKERN